MEGALGIWFAIRPPENGAGTPAVCQTFQDCEQFRRGAGGGTIKVFQSRADAERYAYGVDEIMHSTPVPTTSSLPPPPPQIQFTQPAPPPQLPPVTTWRCTLCNSLETSSITAHQCRREPYITLNALRNPAHFNQPLPPPQIEICEEPTNLTACVSFASQFDIPWCPSGDMAIAVYFDICSPYNTAQYLKHVNTNHNAEVAGVLEAMSIVSQHCLIAPGGLFVLCISSAVRCSLPFLFLSNTRSIFRLLIIVLSRLSIVVYSWSSINLMNAFRDGGKIIGWSGTTMRCWKPVTGKISMAH